MHRDVNNKMDDCQIPFSCAFQDPDDSFRKLPVKSACQKI